VQDLVDDAGVEGKQASDGVDVAAFVPGEDTVGPNGLGEGCDTEADALVDLPAALPGPAGRAGRRRVWRGRRR
jgi:hypothetical protein